MNFEKNSLLQLCSTELHSPDRPLVLRLDVEQLHPPLLLCIQPFDLLPAPLRLVLLGPGVAQSHSLVTQHVLQFTLSVLLSAVLQKRLREGLCFRPGLRL